MRQLNKGAERRRGKKMKQEQKKIQKERFWRNPSLRAFQSAIRAFLAGMEARFDCEIEFLPLGGACPDFLTKEILPFYLGKAGIPLFLEDELCGCFFVSRRDSFSRGEETGAFGEAVFKKAVCIERDIPLIKILLDDGLSSILSRFSGAFSSFDFYRNGNFFSESFLAAAESGEALKLEDFSALFLLPAPSESALSAALKIHKLSGNLAFLPLVSVMREGGSFKDWANLEFATLFLPDRSRASDWQNQQLNDFLLFSPRSGKPKVLIGLRSQWLLCSAFSEAAPNALL